MSLLRIVVSLVVVDGLRAPRHSPSLIDEAYHFDQFARDFGRDYEAGSEEYARRAGIFRASLLQIVAMNSRADRSWTAGVYPFMDWTSTERLQQLYGYDASASRHLVQPSPGASVALQTGGGGTLHERVYGASDDNFEAEAPEPRNQGAVCGSCWAFAAVEAVEAQLMKVGSSWPRDKGKPRLSAQALVDCVPNPKQCGGSGGCGGATPQLAFDFMRTRGVPLEESVPYNGETSKCPLDPFPPGWTRVAVTGWRQLPSNQAQPLMQAIVRDGPVTVAADAHHWAPYRSGIYDECPKDAIPNHAVLAKGYGIAGDTKYWLIQNSWGSHWGEGGSIRILRHAEEDSWCGIDSRPQEGSACDEEADQNVTVCGSCGILYDAVIPIVGSVTVEHLAYSTDSASADAAAASLAAEANSEQGATMPQLNKQVLVDTQASYGGTIERLPVAEDHPMPTLSAQVASPTEPQQKYVSDAFDSTTVAPTVGEASHASSVTARRGDQARHGHVQELATQHFTVAEVVDTWSSLFNDRMPNMSYSAEPIAMSPAEDQTPHDKVVSSSGILAPPLPTTTGLADMVDFGISRDRHHTDVIQHQQVSKPEMEHSDASLVDPSEIWPATRGSHTEGSKLRSQYSVGDQIDHHATDTDSVLPGWRSLSIDSYLRR